MPEGDFREDVLTLVRDASESVCFFTDDDILYRPLVAPMIPSRLLAFSLRLGANTTRCYPHDAEQPLPIVLNDDEDWREWEWKQSDGDFGYPLSLDGHIMNTDMVRPILEESQFGNPNQMEDKLAWTANGTSRLDARPRMGSFPESVLVNVPANRVTETHDTNRVMDAPAYTPLALNDFFLDGWRIAWDEMDYSGVNAAHTELTYVLKKDLDRKRIDQQRYVEL
jgi:hypothetical protein